MNMTDRQSARQSICEIGKRIYAKGFAAANEGNLSIRIGENEIVCTPTLICKGFMAPDDLCVVDLDGLQVSGHHNPTSELLLHLKIYQQRPDVRAVVHCHPPHANAFGIAREPIPTCVLPEPELFLGEVPTAKYETPNSQAFADSILPFVKKSNIVVLANHGTVSYHADMETAYWLTEILDSYCRTLILAKQLGHVEYLSNENGRELWPLARAWGFEDPRLGSVDSSDSVDIRSFASFKSTWAAAGLKQRAFRQLADEQGASNLSASELDRLVEKIADRVVAKLRSADQE